MRTANTQTVNDGDFSQTADKFASLRGLLHAYALIQNMAFVFVSENEQMCQYERKEMISCCKFSEMPPRLVDTIWVFINLPYS